MSGKTHLFAVSIVARLPHDDNLLHHRLEIIEASSPQGAVNLGQSNLFQAKPGARILGRLVEPLASPNRRQP
jgi:hypothetical protein